MDGQSRELNVCAVAVRIEPALEGEFHWAFPDSAWATPLTRADKPASQLATGTPQTSDNPTPGPEVMPAQWEIGGLIPPCSKALRRGSRAEVDYEWRVASGEDDCVSDFSPTCASQAAAGAAVGLKPVLHLDRHAER
jgi:hypothetical protein